MQIFQKLLCSLLIIALFFTATNTANALNPDNYVEIEGIELESQFLDVSLSGFACGEPLITDEVNAKIDEFKKEDANMAEKFLAGQVQNIWQVGPINGMNSLIFGNPYCVWAGEGAAMSADGIFTQSEKDNIIDPMLKLFSGLFVLFLTLAMLISGLKLGFSGIRGKGFADFGEDLKMWMISAFFVLCYSMILNLIFQSNAAVVMSIYNVIQSNGVSMQQASMMATGDSITNVMSFIFVALAEWVLAIILNFVYIARKVIIMLLIILGYVAAYSLLFAKTRAFFGVWFKELIGNVFLQSIHAIVFYGMIMFAANGSGVIFKMGLMLMFIPISGMISKWLNIGDSSSKLGSSLTMMGLGGVMNTMMLASQAGNIIRGGAMMGGNTNMGGSVMSNLANSVNSSGGLSNLTNSMANDSELTAISMDAKGTNSQAWNTAKSAVSNIGGVMGALGGMVAGPAGMVLGAKVGSKVAGGIMQGGRNAAFGLVNTIGQLGQAKNYTGPNGTGFKAMMGDAVARRQFFGNMGEALGGVVGLNSVGRNVGLAMSAVSRQEAAQAISSRFGMTDADGNILPTTFENLSAQYPNADMKMIQTNMGSAFYVQANNGEWQQVGITGAADAALRDGEMRVIDYKLADASVPYQMQPNGTYTAPISATTASNVASGAAPINAQTGQSISGVFPNNLLNGQPVTLSSTMPINSSDIQNMTMPTGTTAQAIPMGSPQSVAGNPTIPMPSPQTVGGATVSGGGTIPVTSSPSVAGNPTIPMPSPQSVGGGTTSATQILGGSTATPIPSPSPQTVGGGSTAMPSPQIVGGGSTAMPSPSPQTVGGGAPTPSPQTVGGGTLPTPTPMPTPTPQQSLSAATQTGGPVRQQTAGLTGSTPHVMRTSNAYIVTGATTNGQVTPQTFQILSQPTTQRFENPEFNAGRVNPDAYVYQNAQGVDIKTGTDKVADGLNTANKVRRQWASSLKTQVGRVRNKNVV